MKKNLLLAFSISITCIIYSNDYDLIVKSNGDSIACHIDSVTEIRIYFEMKANSKWIHTHSEMKDIIDYQYRALDKKLIKFKPGTSHLVPLSQIKAATNVKEIQQNSVYFGYNFLVASANYERLFPLGKRTGITAGAAINAGYIEGAAISIKSTLVFGGVRHYFETGVIAYFPYKNQLPGNVMPLVGYRFLGPKGLLIRGVFAIGWEDEHPMILPEFSIGYSF